MMGQSESNISPAQLKKMIDEQDIYLIDVRGPGEIAASGFIESARRVNIPLSDIDEALNLAPDAYKAKYGLEKPTGDGSDLVFHCASGGRSSVALSKAQQHGFTKAMNLQGGFGRWRSET